MLTSKDVDYVDAIEAALCSRTVRQLYVFDAGEIVDLCQLRHHVRNVEGFRKAFDEMDYYRSFVKDGKFDTLSVYKGGYEPSPRLLLAMVCLFVCHLIESPFMGHALGPAARNVVKSEEEESEEEESKEEKLQHERYRRRMRLDYALQEYGDLLAMLGVHNAEQLRVSVARWMMLDFSTVKLEKKKCNAPTVSRTPMYEEERYRIYKTEGDKVSLSVPIVVYRKYKHFADFLIKILRPQPDTDEAYHRIDLPTGRYGKDIDWFIKDLARVITIQRGENKGSANVSNIEILKDTVDVDPGHKDGNKLLKYQRLLHGIYSSEKVTKELLKYDISSYKDFIDALCKCFCG